MTDLRGACCYTDKLTAFPLQHVYFFFSFLLLSPAAPSPRELYTKFDSLSAFAAFFSRGRAKELEVDC